MTWPAYMVLAVVTLQRLGELLLAERNTRRLLAKGAHEAGRGHYPFMVAVHAGWLIVLITTFLINHFDLFGLRQVWLEYQGKPYTPLEFKTPGPYKLVRHPLYIGWLTVFWATPTMTVSHLLFAVVTTLYILAAIQWEERDLVAAHPEYDDYRRRVPMLVPRREPKPAREAAPI